jgi:predicted RNase H-like HicB family nuclease
MRNHYIALVHRDEDSHFGVSFPDFPGAVTAARTLDDALERAEEALAQHVEGMAEDGEPIPPPSALPRSLGTTPTPCRCSFRFRSQGPCSPSEKGGDEPRPPRTLSVYRHACSPPAYRSASFAHSSHCCHATSSWALAASSVWRVAVISDFTPSAEHAVEGPEPTQMFRPF